MSSKPTTSRPKSISRILYRLLVAAAATLVAAVVMGLGLVVYPDANPLLYRFISALRLPLLGKQVWMDVAWFALPLLFSLLLVLAIALVLRLAWRLWALRANGGRK